VCVCVCGGGSIHLIQFLSPWFSVSLCRSVLCLALVSDYSRVLLCQHYFQSVNPILRQTNNTMSLGEQDYVCEQLSEDIPGEREIKYS